MAGIVDLSQAGQVGIGHLRPRDLEGLSGNGAAWLRSVILPLYAAPGGDHWGWIYQGWLVPKDQPYLAIGRDASFTMVRAYDNLYTIPVLEARPDGWLRIQYTSRGSAWVHTSQFGLGDIALSAEGWEGLLQSQAAVYFLEEGKAQTLRSQPQEANNVVSLIDTGSLIEPLSVEGDWMRVRVTRPVAACEPLTGATVTEGWLRWREANGQPLVWYSPDGSCHQSS